MHANCSNRNLTSKRKITQAKAVANISLMTDFVKEN
jgi:hypothetical protein